MKLIKLSETHYIVVDDSEIKENQWYCNNKVLFLSDNKFDSGNNPNQNKNNKLITHSTQPLEPSGSVDPRPIIFNKIKPLSLSEIEELVNGFSIEKAAYHFCDNVVHPKDETRSLFFAFCTGFNTHQELVKDKLFTIEQMQMLFAYAHQIGMNFILQIQCPHLLPKQDTDALRDEFIQSLLPKTEWECTIDKQGKIKLI